VIGDATLAAGTGFGLELVDEVDDVEEAPLAPPRMQARAMPTATWVLPVPVPPISTRLRCWARKPPPARSRTRVSLMGVPSKVNSSISFAIGNLAMAIWYLIERACFSESSAVSRSLTTRCGSCWRFTAVATTSS
jgi:hypothetical protein